MAAQNRLIAQIAGTDADPLYGLVRISMDQTETTQTRMLAMRAVLPFIHAAAPLETHNTHLHAHAKLDRAELTRRILERIERLAPAATIEAEPVAQPVDPEPEAAD